MRGDSPRFLLRTRSRAKAVCLFTGMWAIAIAWRCAGAAEPEGSYASPEEAARILGAQLAALREQGMRADAAEKELFELRHDLGMGQTEFWGHRVWRIEQQLKRAQPEEAEKVALRERAPMPQSPFGFAAPAPGEMEASKAAQLPSVAASLGLQTVRLVAPFFDPSDAASAPESWRRLDEELGAWSAAGLEPMLVLDYGPKAPASEAAWGAFRRWAGALAERYDGDGQDDSPAGLRVKAFEIQRQVDSAVDLGAPFGDTPQAYAAMARAAAENIRHCSPQAKIVLGSMRSIGAALRSPWYFEQAVGHTFEDGDKMAKYFDVLALDYRPSRAACKALNLSVYSCLATQIARMRKALEAVGSSAPIWLVIAALPEPEEAAGILSGPCDVASLTWAGLVSGSERILFQALAPAAEGPSGPGAIEALMDGDLRFTPAGWALKEVIARVRPASEIRNVSLGAADQFLFEALIGPQDLYLGWSVGKEANVTIAHRVHQPQVQGVALADGPPGAAQPEITMPSHGVKLGPRPFWLTAPGQTQRD